MSAARLLERQGRLVRCWAETNQQDLAPMSVVQPSFDGHPLVLYNLREELDHG